MMNKIGVEWGEVTDNMAIYVAADVGQVFVNCSKFFFLNASTTTFDDWPWFNWYNSKLTLWTSTEIAHILTNLNLLPTMQQLLL